MQAKDSRESSRYDKGKNTGGPALPDIKTSYYNVKKKKKRQIKEWYRVRDQKQNYVLSGAFLRIEAEKNYWHKNTHHHG